MLIMVKGGAVIHFTPNMSLPHAEFVRRTTKELPDGAWVGTVSKLDGEIAAITSKLSSATNSRPARCRRSRAENV